jgi:hypothetical protein
VRRAILESGLSAPETHAKLLELEDGLEAMALAELGGGKPTLPKDLKALQSQLRV